MSKLRQFFMNINISYAFMNYNLKNTVFFDGQKTL